MKKRTRRFIALVVLAASVMALPVLVKALIAIPLLMALLIDLDDFTIKNMKEGNRFE